MKYIAHRKGGPADTSKDHELTDWADLKEFVDHFLRELESLPASGPKSTVTAH